MAQYAYGADYWAGQTLNQQPLGWTRVGDDSDVWKVEEAASVRFLRCNATTTADRFLVPDPAGDVNEMEIVALVRSSDTNATQVGVGVAVSDPGPYGYYTFLESGTQYRRRRLVNGTSSAYSATTFPWTVNTSYWVRMYALHEGSSVWTFRVKWWADGDTEPASWMDSATGQTHTIPGPATVGLFNRDENGEQDWLFVGVGTNGDVAPTSETPPVTVDVPSGFTFTATGLQLDGSWSAVTGADSYDWEIQRDDAGTWVAFDSGNTATLAFQVTTGVAYGTTYRARVRTDDGGVKSDWTAYTSASTPADAVALSAEQIEAVALSWTAATGPYDIRRDETDLIAEGLTVTTFTDDDVAAGTSYTYEVREDGGAWSAPTTVAVVAGGGGVFFLKPNGGGWST